MVKYSATQKYHEFLSAITQNAADGILAFGHTGNIILANRAAAELFGRQINELESQNINNLVRDLQVEQSDADRLLQHLFANSTTTTPQELSATREDGAVLRMEVVVAHAELSDGEQVFIANCRDISDRRAIEDRLRRLARIIDQMHDGVIVLSPDLQVIESNRALEPMAAEGCDVLFGCPVSDALHVEFADGPTWATVCRTAAEEGRWNQIVGLACRGGRSLKADMAVYPLWDGDRTVIAYTAVFRDVTARIEAENRIIQTQKIEALGRLAGGVAHDVNNLLFPIFLNLESALDQLRDAEGFEEACTEIQESMDACLKIKKMIQQILYFSRKNAVDLEPLAIGETISDAWSLTRMIVPSSVTTSVDIEPDCGEIVANSVQISQIVLNLVSNAIGALDNGIGAISLSLHRSRASAIPKPRYYKLRQEEIVVLRVTDTGCGIAPEHVDRIFEPFFTTKEVGQGTGLGLTEVAGIIQSLNGAITVNSAVGEGTEFLVYLPIR